MSLGGSFLQGAKSRLLPASVPFRFFVAATFFQLAAWAALALRTKEAASFGGGPGAALAALHLLTLGVLALTAIGATFQLLPVATKLPIGPLWPPRLVSWLMLPGVPTLAIGMASASLPAMAAGALLSGAGLLIFAVVIANNLRRALGHGLVIAHAWGALGSLVGLIGLGLVLVWDYRHGFLSDHAGVAVAHMALAVYGFMGLLVLGFSAILLPMFALSPAPSKRLGRAALGLAVIAIALGTAGGLTQSTPMLAVGLLFGIATAALHLFAIERSLKRRMRKRLGLSFILVRLGQACLPASLAVGLLTVAGAPIPNGATLFGWLAIGGWLLTFLMGVLQRILPFLASMHVAKAAGRPPLVSELAPETPLQIHAICHLTAIALVAAGIVSGVDLVVTIGATAGFIGAAAFIWFALAVVFHIAPLRRGPPLAARRSDQ